MSQNLSAIGTLRHDVPSFAPTGAALEECKARVYLIAQKLMIEMLNEQLKVLNCPITGELPGDPVVTDCGHLFDRRAIEAWKTEHPNCPLCRTAVTKLTPVRALQGLDQSLLQNELVLTFSKFRNSNPLRAAQYFELASRCINEKDGEGALAFLGQALRYTHASENYAHVPGLYEQLGSPQKALLARVYLSMYQLEEGKIPEALETLKHCGSDAFSLDTLVAALTLHLDPSSEALEHAKTVAAQQKNPEERMFMYKQMIGLQLDPLDAYQQLIPLIQNRDEKRALALEAAERSRALNRQDLEEIFLQQAEIIPLSIALSKEEWANAASPKLPRYPQALRDFLDGDCTVWPGKKRRETHIVVPLFSEVLLGDTPIPLTLESLDRLDRSSGGTGFRYISEQIPKDIPAEKEFHWAVMTYDVLPGSREQSYSAQERIAAEKGYEVPGVLDAARAILWEKRRSGKMCFGIDPLTHTRCKEKALYQVVVGGFAPAAGVSVHHWSQNGCIGVAGWRKF